jgi:hypothetical protein
VLWDFDTAKLTELNLANTVNQADILYLVQDGKGLYKSMSPPCSKHFRRGVAGEHLIKQPHTSLREVPRIRSSFVSRI